MKILKDIPKKMQTTELCSDYIRADSSNIRYASTKVLTYMERYFCIFAIE